MSANFQRYGIYALYLTCFSCLLSSSLLSIFSVLMIVCWLGSGTPKNIFDIVRENSIAIIGIIFCGLLLLGICYSPAPFEDSLDFFKRYRTLLYIPIVLSLTMGKSNIARNIVNAFLLGYGVVLLNAYLVNFNLIEPNHLSDLRRGGGFLVIFAYLVLQRAFIDTRFRWLWIGFFFIICYDIFFILNTRTGWLIFICLSLLFVVQHFSSKYQLIAVVFVVMLGGGIFFTSHSVQQRIDLTIHSLQQYDAKSQNSQNDGAGLRLDWYQNSIELIKERPLFGYGTGAFEIAQKALIEGRTTQPTTDPHNEYLLTSVQLGLVGGFVLLLIFIDPVIRSFKLLSSGNRQQAFALQATVVFLFIGCFLNSWLLSSIPSHIFAFLIAAFYPFSKSEVTG